MTRPWQWLIALLLVGLTLRGLSFALPTPGLMDFGSFIASGEAAGKGLDPYGIYPLTFHVVLPGFESWNPNLNPPMSLPLFEMLSKMWPLTTFRWWWSFSFVCYVGLVLALVRRHPDDAPLTTLWALSLAGFWDTLVLGQIYVPLVAAAVGAWLAFDRGRPILAGLLIGLVVAAKPNFLVWPALLLLAGHLRPVVAAGLSALLLSLLPVAFYGPEVYQQWIELLMREENRAAFLTNASLSGLAHRLGLPELGTAASLGLLAGLAWIAWRRRLPVLHASAFGLIGALLASPIAWVHYTLFLLPVFLMLPHSWPRLAAMAMLAVPVPWILDIALDGPRWLQASWGSLYVWAVLLCLACLWKDAGLARAAEPRRRELPQAG